MPDQKVVKALPTILRRLKAAHPNARYELNWDNPLQLLVATILAAQCTDERVNQVTPALFAKYADASAYANADSAVLEEDLKPTGFYRQKARTVQAVCKELVGRFNGQVPGTMEEMVTLPGVARKTANVVLNHAFQSPTGVIVDTHVQRVSQRMGLTDQKKPEKIELDLMDIVPREEWIFFGPAMVLHGRYTCTFHAPQCDDCVMNDLCPKRGVGADADDSATEEDSPAMATKKTRTPAKKTTRAPKAKEAAKATTKPKTTRAKSTPAPAAPPAEATLSPVANRPSPLAPVLGGEGSGVRGRSVRHRRQYTAAPGLSLQAQLPPDWQAVLADEFDKPYWRELQEFVARERQEHTVYPPEDDVFNACRATPFDRVKVLLLGQDPYHGPGQAHGMCFSVRPGVRPPPSLVNMFKELHDDLGCKIPNHGYLAGWAERGVLLLNAVLTVRQGEPNSHKDRGWETFTDAVIRGLNDRERPVVFLLWGAYAQKKKKLVTDARHRVVAAAHPSPLSAKKFFGSRPYSAVNRALEEVGEEPLDWCLPDRV